MLRQRVGITGLALPNDQNVPAPIPEFCLRSEIPGYVSLKLRQPVFRSGSRQPSSEAALMAMPKAAMHEDDLAEGGEDEIGRAGQITPVKAKTIAHAMG